jgi:hypothetical protein
MQRRAGSLLVAGVLVLGGAGCLDSIIPSHQSGTQGGGGSGGGGGGAGGGSGGGGGGGGGGGAADDMATSGPIDMYQDPNCIPPGAPVIDGHHNAGMACLDCHNGNVAGANKWFAAGTIFSAASGGAGVPGITVEITDANGVKHSIVTAQIGAPGNFWLDVPVVFPITVRASSCPYNRPMTAAQPAGNCNTSGCHAAGNQVHVP